MTETLNPTDFANNLYALLEETFENVQGIYLDKDTSLLQTLETISAAQVAHVTFFIESFERFALQNDTSPVDWGEIWQTVEKVTPEEWETLRADLKNAYQRINTLFHENKLWNETTIGGSLSIVVHTAYHLGEIRQALCTLR